MDYEVHLMLLVGSSQNRNNMKMSQLFVGRVSIKFVINGLELVVKMKTEIVYL